MNDTYFFFNAGESGIYLYTNPGVLIFREKSVFFSFQSPTSANRLNFSDFPSIPEIVRIN